jgi:hypothetical protein
MMSGLIQMSEAHIMPVFPSIELHVTAAMPDSKGLLIMSSTLDTRKLTSPLVLHCCISNNAKSEKTNETRT